MAIESYQFVLMIIIVGQDLSPTEVGRYKMAAFVAWDLAYVVLVYNSSRISAFKPHFIVV